MKARKRNVLIMLMVLNIATCFSQIQWQKSFGGSLSDGPGDFVLCPDGSYIMLGSTSSNDGEVSGNHGGQDLWLLKFDGTGNTQWSKTFGGTADDFGSAIYQTNDSGYVIAGYSRSSDGDLTLNKGNYDYWIIKTDAAGTLLWQKSYGGTGEDRTSDIIQTVEGGYIVSGFTQTNNNGDVTGNHPYGSDYWIVKLNGNGDLEWQKCYGGSAMDGYNAPTKIIQTSDNGYFVSGEAGSNNGDVIGSHGYTDYWVLKVDSLGTLQWQKTYGGSMCDYPQCFATCLDGGYIIAGTVSSDNGDITDHISNCPYCPGMGSFQCLDYWVIKIDSVGTIEWKKSYGGSANDTPSSIQLISNGGYIISGSTNSWDVSGHHWNAGTNDYWALCIDSIGNIIWQQVFGGWDDDRCTEFFSTTDGGFIISGVSASNDGDVSGNHGGADVWIVKLSNEVGLSNNSSNNNKIVVYPNPSSESITFPKLEGKCVIEVYDVYGRLVEKVNTLGSATVSLHKKGIYQYRIFKESDMITYGKFVIE